MLILKMFMIKLQEIWKFFHKSKIQEELKKFNMQFDILYLIFISLI
jgi:hypothetical protein